MQTSGISGKKQVKLDSLTSLRFFAAAMIVLGHANHDFGSFGIASTFPLNQGVSFFFVLSGFVLAYAYPELSNRRQRARFIWARFARIWPAYFTSLVIMLLVLPSELWSVSASHPIGFSLANFCLLHAWIPVRECYLGLNGVSWSISTEFFFYLCFPWLIYRWAGSWPYKIILLLALTGALVLTVNYLQLPYGSQYPGVGSYALLYINPLGRLLEFACGMLVCIYYKSEKVKIAGLTTVGATLLECAALFLTIVTLWIIPILSDSPRVLIILKNAGNEWLLGNGGFPAFALLILVFSWQRGLISRLLSHPLPVLLGEISFSLYLVHSIVLKYYHCHQADFAGLPLSLSVAVYWLISLLLAYLLYNVVEMPCRSFLVRLPDRFGRRYKLLQPRPQFKLRPVLAMVVLGGIVAGAGVYRPPVTSEVMERSAVPSKLSGEQLMPSPARFAGTFKLVQLSRRVVGAETLLSFLWYTETGILLKESVGVHFLNRSGEIIHQADYIIDPGSSWMDAGTYFVTRILVPSVKISPAYKLGIALYIDSDALYRVTALNVDWNRHRLIIPWADEAVNNDG